MIRSDWEAGPFTYAVESPAYVEEWNEGDDDRALEHGQVHVVYGPWQVVIRGIGAHAERRVLATWEFRRSWATTVGIERSETRLAAARARQLGVGRAGRQRAAWMGGSELRLGGALRAVPGGRQRAAARRRQRDAVRGRERVADARRERAPHARRQRVAARRRERAPVRAAPASSSYAGASEMLMRGASERLFARRQRAPAARGIVESPSSVDPRRSDIRRRWATAHADPTAGLSGEPLSEGQRLMATGYFSLVLHAHLPVRPSPRRSDGHGGAVALRGHHRHVPAAAADVRGADRRRHPVPLHGLAVGAAHHDADRRSAQGALRGATSTS